MNLLDIAIRILEEGPICDHCLGRQFAKLSTGLTNKERGIALKTALAMLGHQKFKEGDPSLLKRLASCTRQVRSILSMDGTDEKCWLCNDLFQSLDIWVQRSLKLLKKYQYDTFLIGTKVSGLLAENEEILWAATSSTIWAEPLKSELNREIGKLIQEEIDKEVDFDRPDIFVLLNLAEDKVELRSSSLFIYGRYKKLARGIPQTRWSCPLCQGEGCEDCDYKGTLYTTSVEELMKDPVIESSGGADIVLHGAGREDIDALMLGTGRPFVLEVKEPLYRHFDLIDLENSINRSAENRIEVKGLRFVEKKMVAEVKTADADKVYRVRLTFSKAVSEVKLKASLDKLCTKIKQRTPSRVAHRRSDKVRTRTIHFAKLMDLDADSATICIRCESGLYIKELISGDDERTKPNLSELLGTKVGVKELDVIGVKHARSKKKN
ncbi:MAG: tRNA pseudouridine(54/55) synthase Pus10 [Methanocellales archaeon]|nr:tRNA pseudouridine(54/55) synthase Pus10 [Methanocellales archaeon]MDD4898568.1 tRNA pseudouridine(54/55) synthase Pus10 [Methanocellales archaeon]MDD5446542.1 tRNA pseudouridine(54/55) synthase Pus10 [Methanocellales archaeon]